MRVDLVNLNVAHVEVVQDFRSGLDRPLDVLVSDVLALTVLPVRGERDDAVQSVAPDLNHPRYQCLDGARELVAIYLLVDAHVLPPVFLILQSEGDSRRR